jgi:hypothetical protein
MGDTVEPGQFGRRRIVRGDGPADAEQREKPLPPPARIFVPPDSSSPVEA